MPKKCQGQRKQKEQQEKRPATPTFLLELPLAVDAGQAARLRAHLEAARQLYNAILSQGQQRLRRMRSDPAWQEARALPRTHKAERAATFSALRKAHGFSEAALHEAVKGLRVGWIAAHIEAVLAQTLATRAYRALNRVCLGKGKRVRFKSRGRGLSSIENKRNDTSLRFVLQPASEGNAGYLLWNGDQMPALINWKDEVVTHGLRHRIKYARLIQRPASSPRAAGADAQGSHYVVQLALEGKPHHKPKHTIGQGIVGADLGPSTLALVPQQGEASLQVFCAELAPEACAICRLQRQMDRQRRAGNPEHYDEKGRVKKQGKKRLPWKNSKRYQATRRRKATKERKLAAHRKSLHGRKVHEVVALGRTIILEKVSYKAWQKRFGKSVGLRAPGMFVELLRRTVASTGGTLVEVPTRTTALSQWCHGCGRRVKKPLSQRWHHCECGVGPVQRDLYSAFLAAYLDPAEPTPSCARYQAYWEGAEARLRAAHERLAQRAREGQSLPRSFGIPRAGARLPKSPGEPPQEPAFPHQWEGLEAWNESLEPPAL
ncbi:zinc ribbon domain-containing protein [Ktedonobacter racemifer]|uniref:Transposase IS605 OrfB n=1 Tax=Ktedonobacter racemifer DSM 44963 TaxID=485913 RepID=D6TRP7_KTERA|nr:zinc ribbon domain-containing protein [Ktedonobacter racemifer]EFH85999.1 transposase IS605 OrfB [Ktedonobacter racemifer DSM 44963]